MGENPSHFGPLQPLARQIRDVIALDEPYFIVAILGTAEGASACV